VFLNVCFALNADICSAKAHVRFTPKRCSATRYVCFGAKADIRLAAGSLILRPSAATRAARRWGPVVIPPGISKIVGRVVTNVVRVVISPVGRRIDWIAPVI
jgi:hypothetical protein